MFLPTIEDMNYYITLLQERYINKLSVAKTNSSEKMGSIVRLNSSCFYMHDGIQLIIILIGVSSARDLLTVMKCRPVTVPDTDIKFHSGMKSLGDETFELLKPVIDKYSNDRITIIGHSMGAGLVCYLMIKLIKCCYNIRFVGIAPPLHLVSKNVIEYFKLVYTNKNYIFILNDNDPIRLLRIPKISMHPPPNTVILKTGNNYKLHAHLLTSYLRAYCESYNHFC